MTRRVIALDTFFGSPGEGIKKPGDSWEVTETRANELEKLGLVKPAPQKVETPKPEDRDTKPAKAALKHK